MAASQGVITPPARDVLRDAGARETPGRGLARAGMLTVAATAPMLLVNLATGILTARVLGPAGRGALTAVFVALPSIAWVFGTLWLAGALTVSSAVAATVAVGGAAVAALSIRVLRRHGLARPSREIARRTLWYGVRAHSTSTAGIVNTRLDLLIIPAFLGAASVGLKSVAASVSLVVVAVAGSLGTIVFPAAAARGREGRHTVVKSLYATLAIAIVLAGTIAAVAGVAVRIVYGADFAGSVTPLRILLVGTVLYAAAGVACSGLYAVNRPFTAALAQFTAAAVTVAGLSLFLRSGGTEPAATVSTVAYALVFVIAVLQYRRTAGLTWREPAPSVMATWFRQATRGALGRA